MKTKQLITYGVIAGILAVGGYIWYTKNRKKSATTATTPSPKTNPVVAGQVGSPNLGKDQALLDKIKAEKTAAKIV